MFKFPGFLAKRALLHRTSATTPRLGWRYSSTQVRNTNHRNVLLVASGGLLLALGLSPSYAGRVHADSETQPSKSAETSLGALIRSYAVYTMCSIPALVDHSPKILELASLPGLKWITEAFVRITFFDQFVGGDTAQKTLPLLHSLRAANKGALFAYSVEVDEVQAMQLGEKHKGPSLHKRIVDEMIRCIDIAADFEDNVVGGVTGRRTWVAVKITALVPDAELFTRLSSYLLATRPIMSPPVPFPGCPHATDLDILHKPAKGTNPLSTEDIASLRELHADLVRICKRGQERGVKIVIDAEHSWYQPALDALTLSLMCQFNKLPSSRGQTDSIVQPLVYGTYQAYLRRTPSHLATAFADAKLHNYALGIKLVRGAYHPHELAAHASHGRSLSISPDALPPVWTSKFETDACYNECAAMIVGAVKADIDSRKGRAMNVLPSVGVLFGTHNWDSCKLILNGLVESGLASQRSKQEGDLVVLGDEVTERLVIGQLYGMSDDLTNYLVQKTCSKTPLVIKYVPYGTLSEVMPYLSRRAIENKSVLGDGVAAKERRRAGAEIRRRLFGSWVGA